MEWVSLCSYSTGPADQASMFQCKRPKSKPQCLLVSAILCRLSCVAFKFRVLAHHPIQVTWPTEAALLWPSREFPPWFCSEVSPARLGPVNCGVMLPSVLSQCSHGSQAVSQTQATSALCVALHSLLHPVIFIFSPSFSPSFFLSLSFFVALLPPILSPLANPL